SVGVVTAAQARDALPNQPADWLTRVPGVVALDRQNAAQDLQLSVRGFGSRASFGVRGVRLYEDGVPLSQPDGQGQTGTLDWWNVQRLEVLRGPMSVMYGNAAGGVIQVFSTPPAAQPEARTGLVVGEHGLWAVMVEGSGPVSDTLGVSVQASAGAADGQRQHSRYQREAWRARLQWQPSDGETLNLIARQVRIPEAQDPLGLTEGQWRDNPDQADPVALRYNTRKAIEQTQLSLQHEWRQGAQRWQWLVYGGERAITQFQSIPAPPDSTVQTRPTHPGGVIDLKRRFVGADMRRQWQGEWLARPFNVLTGVSVDQLNETRRGFQNFVDDGGTTVLGVQGALRRDERNTITQADPYVQAQWDVTPAWQLQAARGRQVELGSQWRWSRSGMFNLSLYEVRTRDEIAVARNSFGRSTFQNVGGTVRQGVEASLDVALWPEAVTGLRVRSALGWMRARTTEGFTSTSAGVSTAVPAGRTLPGIPQHTAWTELVWRPQPTGWHTALEWRHQGRLWANDVNDAAAPSSSRWGWRLGWRAVGDTSAPAQAWRLDALLRVDNLFNSRDVSSVIVNEGNRRFFEPAPGRTVSVSVNLQRGF
ncbi:MAG: TonB-dependent receptor family protein, partial [Aquabacterium sp.]